MSNIKDLVKAVNNQDQVEVAKVLAKIPTDKLSEIRPELEATLNPITKFWFLPIFDLYHGDRIKAG